MFKPLWLKPRVFRYLMRSYVPFGLAIGINYMALCLAGNEQMRFNFR